MRRLIPLALAVSAAAFAPLPAQSILDAGLRVGPQFLQYKLQAPTNTTISEFAAPVFVLIPLTSSLSFDVGSAYAWSRVEQTASDGKQTVSTISGATDTQIRGNYTVGTDFIVLTAGVNLPSGRSTVTADQQLAAGLIGSDFLSFPVSNMGTGFGATGGLAIARPLGSWNVGGGASVRKSSQYDPFNQQGAPVMHYQPGDEYRVRVGLDRGVGTGRMTLGLTYSRFGNDNLGGSIYNTGDRVLSHLSFVNTIGVGDLSIVGWNLYRNAGTLADSSFLGHEDIGNVLLGYAVRVAGMRIEPTVEGRGWLQQNLPTSALGTVGLRIQFDLLGLGFTPSGSYTMGRLAAQTAQGAGTTADLTGFKGMLTVRLR
jgi:hypothetical protein